MIIWDCQIPMRMSSELWLVWIPSRAFRCLWRFIDNVACTRYIPIGTSYYYMRLYNKSGEKWMSSTRGDNIDFFLWNRWQTIRHVVVVVVLKARGSWLLISQACSIVGRIIAVGEMVDKSLPVSNIRKENIRDFVPLCVSILLRIKAV